MIRAAGRILMLALLALAVAAARPESAQAQQPVETCALASIEPGFYCADVEVTTLVVGDDGNGGVTTFVFVNVASFLIPMWMAVHDATQPWVDGILTGLYWMFGGWAIELIQYIWSLFSN